MGALWLGGGRVQGGGGVLSNPIWTQSGGTPNGAILRPVRIALLLLCAALSGYQTRDDASLLIRNETAPSLRYIHAGRKAADQALALGYGRPATMYRIERDGALVPVGMIDMGGPEGGIEYAPSAETDAIWFLAPMATAAVHWDSGTATRIELGAAPEVTGCDGCRLDLVGQRRIVPGRAGGAVVVRNFADRSREHRYCEVVQVSPTGVLARDVFSGLGEPVRTLNSPAVMVSEQERTVFRVLGETGWSSRAVSGARSYEGWVEADDALYQVDGSMLVRLGLSAADPGPVIPFPGLRPLAISPAREGGLWAIIQGESGGDPAAKPPHVLVRLERSGQTSTSLALPDSFACVPAAPEELADGRVVVPCRGWDGRVNSVDVLVHGQWQKLRSAENETVRARADRSAASQRVARAIAPWLTNTSPMVLVFVHLLFMAGLWLATRGAATGTPSSRLWGLLAALLGATAGLLFGFFEQLASGWWRNDSLFPSFAREEWWLAKFTAAVAGAYLGARLSRLGARPTRLTPHRRQRWRADRRTVKRVGIAVAIAAVAAAIGIGLTWDPTSFRSEQFLIAGRLPKEWTSSEHPGSLGFSVSRAHAQCRLTQSAAWVEGVTVEREIALDGLRNRPPPTHRVTEVSIDTQPALQVQTEMQRSYYVKNRSGELLEIRFEEATPAGESDEFLSNLRFLPGGRSTPMPGSS